MNTTTNIHSASIIRAALLALAALLSLAAGVQAQTLRSWQNTGTGTAWFTATNWSPNTLAADWGTSDTAQFNNIGAATISGINMNTVSGALSIGAIEVSSARTRNLTIGNSSATVGTLTLNGTTVNSVANVIVRNNSGNLLTLQNNDTGVGKTMNIALGNATDNKIVVDGAGGVTISSVISGASRNLTIQGGGSGTVTLSGTAANTYSGTTTVSTGTLSLSKTAGVNAIAGNLSVSSGATLLISADNQVANSSAVTLSGGTILRGATADEVFGNLNLTTASFLDYGATGTGSLQFGTYTPSSLLTVSNFRDGSKLIFGSDLTTTVNNASFFSFDNGFTSNWDGSLFTITAVPEPSTYAAAAGLIGLMLWPARRRIVRDAQRILGLRRPMRDRLARLRA